MSEPIKINVPNKDYYAWNYEEQTQIKHKVFEAYWKIWVSKLGYYYNTMFMDCHGGCGAYVVDDNVYYGSSIIADRVATQVNSKSNRQFKNYICVCETKPDNFANLQKVWADQNCSKYCSFKNEDFNKVIFDPKVENFYSTHPTLFLIDPCGYDLIMKNMNHLMSTKGNEIIINFMFDYINRFLSLDKDEDKLNRYFGNDMWKKAISLSGYEREMYLVELYKDSLKQHTGAKFVYAYRLSYPDKNQTYYYLIHATNNIQGITYMKDSFASINNGRVEFVGKKQNAISLFDLPDYKAYNLSETLWTLFTGKTMSFEKIWEIIVEDVPYVEKDLVAAIKQLEKYGKVSVQRISSKRGNYQKKDLVTFGA